MSKSIEKTSKFLSYVLRHRPDSIGIELDANGWANIAVLIECATRHGNIISEAAIREAVRTSDKQRFLISDDDACIRANQGHSVKVDLELVPANPPDCLFHGTASRFVESIMKTGLNASSRHHVHMSATRETAIAVGTRHGKPVVLKVDAQKMQQLGYLFYLSENGVWLTDAVPPEFIVQGD